MILKTLSQATDPIRLNLFFDLLFSLSLARDLDSLNLALSAHLRLIVDFDENYFVVGGQPALPNYRIYTSYRSAPRAILGKEKDLEIVEKILLEGNGEFSVLRGGSVLYFPLNTAKNVLGSMIFIRSKPFTRSETRFAEAISGFVTQMIDHFATHTESVRINARLKESELHAYVLVRKLEEERDVRERFVSTLTHDLRTPLTAAKLAAELLGRKAFDAEIVKVVSSRIASNIDRLDRMIRDLLDANRLAAGDGMPVMIEECRLDLIVEEVVKELTEVYGLRFQIENKIGEIPGYWDHHAIQRVLENLATNGIKYGHPDTPVTIRLDAGSDWVEIAVHNEGLAISPEDQEKLFKQYRRSASAVDSGQKGWGIGLTLVKGIAEAHRGSVRIESVVGSGTTTFYVRFALDARGIESL